MPHILLSSRTQMSFFCVKKLLFQFMNRFQHLRENQVMTGITVADKRGKHDNSPRKTYE